FKARGMFNRMRSNPVPAAGVVIASGGNAGIAVACAAKALGVRCEVFVPESSSRAKRDKLAQLGAVVTVGGAGYADALAASLERQAQTGALLMHAYDQREVVIGAATLGAEVEADAGVPDRALVSVGGGGLIAGVCAWFGDRCTIDALEPELAPTLFEARAAGRPVDVAVSGIAADSLGARRIGAIAWALTERHVDAAHLLADAAIRAAQETLWNELRLAVEPAAALPLAALTTGAVKPQRGEKVLLVVCGANLDLASLAN
ncbi:MAG: serine/threonine dehydratase, partial [Pseudomonadota bacterium]|nr:serine/threonine dehydratase [Pseudomonadota bacterium]